MKKLILFVLAFCAVTFTYGQQIAGLKAGLNLANVRFGTENRNNSRLGWYAGGFTQVDINEKILVQPELLYSIKGYAFNASVTNNIYNNSGTLALHYINLPVLFGYRASDKISVFLGPEIGYLLQAKSKSSNVGTVDVTRQYRRFDKGIDLGMAYRVTKRIGAELRYNYGFKGLQFALNPNGSRTGRNKIGENRVLQLGLYLRM